MYLKPRYRQLSHFIVAHRPVGQLHVDVPGRVRHDHAELAQHFKLKVSEIALNPLSRNQFCTFENPASGASHGAFLHLKDYSIFKKKFITINQ